MKKPDMSVKIGTLTLQNPVMPASGTFGKETCELCDVRKIGAIIPKSITLRPRQGNKPPRVAETVGGMLNAVGIQNKGLDHFIKDEIPYYKQYEIPIIVSISGYSVDEFKEMVERLNPYEEVSAIELNISCPNLKAGGKAFGMSCEDTYHIVKNVKNSTDKIVIPKLTPNVEDIVIIAKSAEEAGADAVSLTNTYLGMAIDIYKRQPKLGNILGGLSGPAIKPLSLRMVWQVAKKIDIPIIGIGGIQSWEDAVEFLLAGATGIQVGTGNFVNPKAMNEIIEGIEQYMTRYSIYSMEDIIGKLT